MPPTDPTAAERQRRARQRKADSGLKLVRLWVYPEDEKALREAAQKLTEARIKNPASE